MAIRSSLVTARSGAAMRKFELQKNSKVGENLNLDPKAKNYYSLILKNYDNIRSLFTKIANEYTSCASKSVNGDQLQTALKKTAKSGSYQCISPLRSRLCSWAVRICHAALIPCLYLLTLICADRKIRIKTYCNDRKQDLIACFRYAKLESEIQKLIEQLNAQASK